VLLVDDDLDGLDLAGVILTNSGNLGGRTD
jgi:hypothetical protein